MTFVAAAVAADNVGNGAAGKLGIAGGTACKDEGPPEASTSISLEVKDFQATGIPSLRPLRDRPLRLVRWTILLSPERVSYSMLSKATATGSPVPSDERPKGMMICFFYHCFLFHPLHLRRYHRLRFELASNLKKKNSKKNT